jgi:hypothetical protein
MQVLSTSSRSNAASVSAWAVAASCLVGAFPTNAVGATSLGRTASGLLRASGGTAELSQRRRDPLGIYLYSEEARPSQVTTRATTEQEHLIAKLRSWSSLAPNWDGEGAFAPVPSSLRFASDFVCLLPPTAATPEPLLHASGRAGLSWDEGENYGELEFLENGLVAYYFTEVGSKHKGIAPFTGSKIPLPILALIPANVG